MAEGNATLLSFESVDASVGGVDISSITEMQLSASANSIPSITLLVDAGNSGASGAKVDAMSLGRVRAVLDDCRAMVKTDSGTLNLSLTVKSFGKGGTAEQQFSLTGWILTDAALSPVQVGGVVTVALTFMHPICKSHFGGAVPGLLENPMLYTGLDGENPLEVFLSAIRLYGEQAEREIPRKIGAVAGSADVFTIREELLTRLAKASDDLASALTWTGDGGLPAADSLAAWGDITRVGLASYAMPYGGSSVFLRFARTLVPECSLAIGGDFTQGALEVGPFVPWADPSLRIDDSEILSLQFPQSDPSPISGVQVQSSDTSDALGTSYHHATVQEDKLPGEVFYVPQSEFASDYLYGPIQQFSEPGWVAHIHRVMLAKSDKGRGDSKAASSGRLQFATNTPRGGGVSFAPVGENLPSVNYSAALMACAKAYYETSLMKDWSFTVTTPILFRSGGSILCPGKSLAVTSGGATVIEGYVTNVTHVISLASKAAHTTLTCTHPRFGSLPKGISSTKNALYS